MLLPNCCQSKTSKRPPVASPILPSFLLCNSPLTAARHIFPEDHFFTSPHAAVSIWMVLCSGGAMQGLLPLIQPGLGWGPSPVLSWQCSFTTHLLPYFVFPGFPPRLQAEGPSVSFLSVAPVSVACQAHSWLFCCRQVKMYIQMTE